MSEIDVSKCEFYYDNYCGCCIDSYGDCYHKCTDEELNNCYYKQLQQLKQECDLYKTWYRAKHNDLKNFLGQLKAENEKLKQDLQEETKLRHKAMCDEADMAWEVTKLHKVLDEIEGICKECHKHDYDLCCTCRYADNCRADDEYISYDVANYIHSIIKQAKEGE